MNGGGVIPLRRAVVTADEPLSDAGLVAACAAGDRAAKAQLVERHVDRVYAFVARMRASDADSVDDLVQTTFLRAFEGARKFRGTSARSWLFGIAVNVTREYARGEIRRKRALGVVASEVVGSVAAVDVAALARLPAVLAELTHDLRAAFVLIDVLGESGKDAAAALGVPEGTLWRRVFEARTAVRRALGGGEP